MQELEIYQFDSFTSEPLKGNPAAVMPLQDWLPDELMLKIARENNLSETAFLVPEGSDFRIRWFTPTTEVELCGHATLAAAEYVLGHRDSGRDSVTFHCSSGPLHVRKDAGKLVMDFPLVTPESTTVTPDAEHALGVKPSGAFWGGPDLFFVLENEDQIRTLTPDFRKLQALSDRGVVVTAHGKDSDFVSRAFFPAVGIDEDPVTGSIHCALTPYWAEELGEIELHARQLSERGGEILCRLNGTRVELVGTALLYMKGTAFLP